MPYQNPRLTAYMDGLLKAPSDATARPTAKGSGIKAALRAALAKLSEWDTRQGRDLAATLPEGTTLQQGMIPAYIGGPKAAAGLAQSEQMLAVAKARQAELAGTAMAKGMPDLLPAMHREANTKSLAELLRSHGK